MPDLSFSEAEALLDEGFYCPRDFMWVVAKRKSDGVEVSQGFWSDIHNVEAPVFNPDTNQVETRQFTASGTLIEVSGFADMSNLTVQEIKIKLPPKELLARDLLREFDLSGARVEIFEGVLSPETRRLVAPATRRFAGRMDYAPERRNEDGEVTADLIAVSDTQELGRFSTETRSDESQRLRNPTDNFFEDTPVVGQWELFWGMNQATPSEAPTPYEWGGPGSFDGVDNLPNPFS